MVAEIVEFEVKPEDRAELDRLVEAHGGDRDQFLREVIRVMSALDRAQPHVGA